MGIVAWLAKTALGEFAKGLFGAVLAGIQQQQTRADQIGLGQQQQVTADAVAALAAQRRMELAGVQPNDVATAAEALRHGTF